MITPTISLFISFQAQQIDMTVKEMLPFLINNESNAVWVEETNDALLRDKLKSRDPNDLNTYVNMKYKIKPLWLCTDGSGKDQVAFACWYPDPAKCEPEWHKLFQLTCAVSCSYYETK